VVTQKNEKNVLGIDLWALKKEELIGELVSCLNGDTKNFVCKINTEFFTRAIKDENFAEILDLSDLNIVDGRGVLWAARYLTLPIGENRIIRTFQAVWQMIYSGAAIVLNPKFITYPILENIPGVDALKLMLGAAETTKSGVFFFGATQDELDRSTKNLKKEFPELIISGSLNGYDFQNNETINPVSVINKTNAKLLVVALGSPLQEYWIHDNLRKLVNVRVAVGEGGSLDRIARPFQAAPRWVNKAGLEWLWRLLFNKSLTTSSGSRLKRVWNAVPVFIYEVVKWKIKYGATEIK
jgi:N-acetylglucosaminyldiphosphoundecaprenol N-acetyl-beta-D-mannosaminyltransferase